MSREDDISDMCSVKDDCSFGSRDGRQGLLYLFTFEYPYGKTSETYIETEIKYLSSKFERVVIVPSLSSDSYVREVPDNVEVRPLGIKYGLGSAWVLLRNFPKLLSVLMYELKHTRRKMGYFRNVAYYKILAKNILKYDKLKREIGENGNGAMFYDYWFVNSTLALALLKKEGLIGGFFSRAHGFDVYDDRALPTPAFINYVIKYIDRVFTVSKSGERELKSKLSPRFMYKIGTSYIGTVIPSKILMKKEEVGEEFLILSCSDVVKVKRLHLIVDVLSKLKTKRKVRWVHIGDGDCMDDVRRRAEERLKNIDFELIGSVKGSEVIEFYERNNIGLFINLSESEGLPVSIMEACSYGVPSLASNVGGVAEIVNDVTGVLVDVNEDTTAIAAKIDDVADGKIRFDRNEIARFCKERFDSDMNYGAFMNLITK